MQSGDITGISQLVRLNSRTEIQGPRGNVSISKLLGNSPEDFINTAKAKDASNAEKLFNEEKASLQKDLVQALERHDKVKPLLEARVARMKARFKELADGMKKSLGRSYVALNIRPVSDEIYFHYPEEDAWKHRIVRYKINTGETDIIRLPNEIDMENSVIAQIESDIF